jgi:hypothetical protein
MNKPYLDSLPESQEMRRDKKARFIPCMLEDFGAFGCHCAFSISSGDVYKVEIFVGIT